MDKDLNFKLGNPGAVQYGNFINYYQFHPPDERIKLLPKDIWVRENSGTDFIALDIGCNAGDLTLSLHNFLTGATGSSCSILGVDIDPVLIERAIERNTTAFVTFRCLDFTHKNQRDKILNEYLHQHGKTKFDAVFCFSTTMWIHLNHGDDGLRDFLETLCRISELLIVEPQPWKCYRAALKRVKNSDMVFPLVKKLVLRSDVEEKIEEVIVDCGKVKVRETERTQWGRKLLFFKS